MSEAAIHAEGISYAYGDLLAVDNVSFEVEPGKVLGFLGPNGAGKTTTVKMLTGQLEPKTGRIRLFSQDVKRQSPEIQGRIGVCFEEKNHYLNMSAKENLQFFAGLFGIKNYDAEAALRRVDLAGREKDRVKEYSKGMRQRLMIARSLVNTPDVLFLDEPSTGLDPVSSQSIREIIKQEAERGAAVFLTTHDMHEADELSDHVAFMNEGKIVALDTPENLKLEHGKRSVKVRRRKDGEVTEEIIPLDVTDAGEQLKTAVGVEGLMTIHTEEASLENIFIKLTGRGLE